ncbi:hypothetical protein POPTR_004G164034v4 [Populus trichocarpa]|uniref:B box-type domain-containing protein n=1 Tax=Populus trichocarpa TaxID=3694 RepID=A0A3N7ETL3_POPTR|nr:hypothetical protein POPTR_004G164034v4 [Populus trichocarpa]
MGAPLNLPLFPYPLMFAFNNELKDPSFSFSLLFTLISRSTLGGNTMRFFQTCRALHKHTNSQMTLLSMKHFTQLLTLQKKLEEQWVIPRTGVIPSLYSRGE